MKKNIIYLVLLIILIFPKSTFSQDFAEEFGKDVHKMLKAFADASEQRAEFDFQITNARKNYWDAINSGKLEEKIISEYKNQLNFKDMHFLFMEINAALSGNRKTNEAYEKLIGILSGSGGELDNGINMFAKDEFAGFINRIKSSLSKVKLNNITELYTESFRNQFAEILISHQDSYLNYVSKRDISEYLINNPYSPLLSDNPDEYMSALFMLFEKCNDKEDCINFVNDFKKQKSIDDDTFKLIAFIIKDNNNKSRNYIESFSGDFHYYLDKTAYYHLDLTFNKIIALAENAKKRGKPINRNLITENINDYYISKRNNSAYHFYSNIYDYEIEIVNIKWTPPYGEVKLNTKGVFEFEISHPIYKNIPSTKFRTLGINPANLNASHSDEKKLSDMIAGKSSSIKVNITVYEDNLVNNEYKVIGFSILKLGVPFNGEVTYYGKKSDNIIKSKCSAIYDKCQEFFKNGKLRLESNYQGEGIETRYFNQFLEDGTHILKNGKGIFKYFGPNGNIIFESELREGARDGIATWYYENGQIRQSALYKYNEGSKPTSLRWEIISSFHSSGKKREKGSLKEGNGKWLNYDTDGKMIGADLYKNGVKQVN